MKKSVTEKFIEFEGINFLSPKWEEGYFSWQQCECCHEKIGGIRYDILARHVPTGDILEYSVCSDCYLELFC